MKQMSLSDLGPMVGQPGGQGTVHELIGTPDRLIKIYHLPVLVDPAALEELVQWRTGLAPADRAVVERATCWPVEAVTIIEDGRLGVEIPRAPARFFHTVGGVDMPRDISWAYLADAVRFAGLEPARPAAATRIVRQLAELFDVFARTGVMYGDLSHSNLLWSGGERPDVFLIDCDAAGLIGRPRALAEAQTMLWDCPWPAVTEQERDLYKLALTALRLVMRHEGPLDPSVHTLVAPVHPPVTIDFADLLEAGLREQGARPSAQEWIPVLDRLEKGLRARKAA